VASSDLTLWLFTPCTVSSPWVWGWHGALLPSNRLWHRQWDVTSMRGLANPVTSFLPVDSPLSWLWWSGCLMERRGHWQEIEWDCNHQQALGPSVHQPLRNFANNYMDVKADPSSVLLSDETSGHIWEDLAKVCSDTCSLSCVSLSCYNLEYLMESTCRYRSLTNTPSITILWQGDDCGHHYFQAIPEPSSKRQQKSSLLILVSPHMLHLVWNLPSALESKIWQPDDSCN
jgi:hypothetical protein